MKSLFSLHCCCCFSGNILWMHQFSSKTPTLHRRFISPPSSPSICSWFSEDPHAAHRTTIFAALPTRFGPCRQRGECSLCHFRMQTLSQGLFFFPYVAVKTRPCKHLGLSPSIFNRKIQGLVISFFFFFSIC